MPRIKNSELQFDPINSANQPRSGVSLYCVGTSLKFKKSGDSTEYTIAMYDDLEEKLKNTNYYTTSEIDSMIGALSASANYVKLNGALPLQPAPGNEFAIHLVPKTGGGYSEWLYVDHAWERVGEDDLSNYVTQTQLQNATTVTFKDWTK